MQVPYSGEWLRRPIARNEWSLIVPTLASASIALNNALGLSDTQAPGIRNTTLLRASSALKKRNIYVDLRKLFELQSAVFLMAVYLFVRLLCWLYGIIHQSLAGDSLTTALAAPGFT